MADAILRADTYRRFVQEVEQGTRALAAVNNQTPLIRLIQYHTSRDSFYPKRHGQDYEA